MVFNANKSRSTILLGVGNCSVFFIKGFSESFNLGDTILIKVSNCLTSSIEGSFKSFNLGNTVLICI